MPASQSLCFWMTQASSGIARAAGMTLQDQVQHGHEVALAAAEAAVQVGRLARAALDRAADERQGGVEVLGQFRRDDVVVQHPLRVLDVLGEAEDEVALLHAVGDLDQVFDEGHGTIAKFAAKFASRRKSLY